MRRSPQRKLLLSLVGASALAVAGLTSVASSSGNDIVGEAQHFIECFGFMITDPVSHQQSCQPNRVVVPFASLSESVAAGAPAPAPAPAPSSSSGSDT